MQAKEDLDAYLSDTLVNKLVESKVPPSCKQNPCILGIDEAGRGPVLGPMSYGIAYYPQKNEGILNKMQFADSKALTESRRESLFEAIQKQGCGFQDIGYMIKIIAPNMISNSMLRRHKYDLNSLSHDTAIDLIRCVQSKGIDIAHVYIDTVGPAIKYKDKLKSFFPKLDFTVAEKADSKYPIVSAASVCAKVMRDRIVQNWRYVESDSLRLDTFKLGSGYPADPDTKRFLEDSVDPVFGFATIARFSWSTIPRALEKNGCNCAWNEPEDKDSPKQVSNQKNFMRSFFQNKAKGSLKGTKKMEPTYGTPINKARSVSSIDPSKPCTTADKFLQDRHLDRLMEISFCQ